MRLVLIAILTLAGLALAAPREEARVEVDPNTKIEGGADVHGSGAAAAGTTTPADEKEQKNPAKPEEREPEKDKPTSERKPQERAAGEREIPDRCLRGDSRCVP